MGGFESAQSSVVSAGVALDDCTGGALGIALDDCSGVPWALPSMIALGCCWRQASLAAEKRVVAYATASRSPYYTGAIVAIGSLGL